MIWWWAVACRDQPGDVEAVDRLVRASLTLRGVRPSLEELRDPAPLEEIARTWLTSDAFGATMRDLHAEQLLVRYDTYPHVPAVGPLAAFPPSDVIASLDEEPLRLIEAVIRDGRPYTEIVTAGEAAADPITAAAYGLSYDAGDPSEWQPSWYLDGRPAAGILASTAVLQRHMSSETNHHRTRSHLVLSTLLCSELAGAAVLDPTIAEVGENPACAGCHTVLDPIASAFSGATNYFVGGDVTSAYADGCPDGAACYPLPMWAPSANVGWDEAGMPAPALNGEPVEDLAALGRAIAEDPRFASCTTRRFLAYLTQTALDEVAEPDVERFTAVLVDSGWDARELALAIAVDPAFAPDRSPPRHLRPEQLSRATEAATGFRWLADVGGYGVIDHATTDEYGFRTLLGGLDGWSTIRPSHHASATRELALDWLAQEAAAAAVDGGALPPPGLGEDERLRDLHLLLAGEPDPDLAPSKELLASVRASGGSDADAWKVLVAALLLDDRWVTY